METDNKQSSKKDFHLYIHFSTSINIVWIPESFAHFDWMLSTAFLVS